jgi:hypothetical protein
MEPTIYGAASHLVYILPFAPYFSLIQKWLEKHGPFDAVMDAANVGLSKSHLSLSKASMLRYIVFYLG